MARRLFAILTMVGAGALLYLAVPRTIAAIVALPKDHLVAHVLNGEALSSIGLEQLLASREHALAWERSERRFAELALAMFLLAEELAGAGDNETSRAYVVQTIALSRDGLALAPSRPFAWARLAYAGFVLDQASTDAAAALEMSLLTAPYEPLLTFLRLELGLRAWDVLSDRQRQLIVRQVGIAWHQSPRTLVNVAILSDQVELVRGALPDTDETVRRFEELLRDAASSNNSERRES